MARRTKEEQEAYERAFEQALREKSAQREEIQTRTQNLLAQRVARDEQARMNAAVQQEPSVSQVQNETQWPGGIMLPGTFGTNAQNMYSRAFEAPDIAQQTRTQPKSQYEQMNAVKQAWDASDPSATNRVMTALKNSQEANAPENTNRLYRAALLSSPVPDREAADKELSDSLAALSQSTGMDEQTLYSWAERMQNPDELAAEMDYYRQNEAAMHMLGEEEQAALRRAAEKITDAVPINKYTSWEEKKARKEAQELIESTAEKLGISSKSLKNYLQRQNNEENMADVEQTSKTLGAEHPVLSSAGSVVTSLLGRVPSAVDYGVQYLSGKLGDEYLPLDTNTKWQALSRATQEIRGQVSGDLEEAVQDATGSEGLGSAASLVYNAGLSGVDSIAQAALLGGNPILVGIGAGASAFSDTVTSAKEKGASDSQAMAAGVASGIAESLFEQISLGNLKAMAKVNPKGLRDVVLNFGKSLAVEGSEEAMTEAANIVADAIIMGDVSDYNIAKNAWMEAGSSEEEAEKQALKELIVRVAMAGAGGMIMGAGTSGAGMAYSAANTYNAGRQINQSGNLGELIGQGLSTDATSEAYTQAAQLAQKQLEGARIGNYETGRLANDLAMWRNADGVFMPPLPQNEAQTPGVFHQAAQQRALEEAKVTEEELSAIDRMASDKGLNVEYVYDTTSGVDGFIRGNTITVNLASDSASFGTAVHEIGHSMRKANEAQYVKFQNAVLRMAEQDETLSDYANQVRSMYTAQNSPALKSLLNEDGTVNSAALDEEVSLKLAEQIVSDPQKLTEAVSGDRGLMATFLDFVRGIKNSIAIKLTNSQKAMLDEAERTLVNLLRGESGSVDGTRYSYVGEGAQLTRLQQSTLETAKQLEQSGEDAENIRRETGWFRSMDGKWRTELDDSTARLNWSVEDGEARLGDVLEHPALFRAHPELAEVRLRTGKLPDRVRGKFDRQSNTILLNEKLAGQPKSVLLHEIQHAIQQSEGFAVGSNTENGKWHVLLDAYRRVKDTPQYQQLQTPDERQDYVERVFDVLAQPTLEQAGFGRYRRAAGETEARDTANRADYSAAQRALTRPDLRGEARYSERGYSQAFDMLRGMGYSESEIREKMRGFQNGRENHQDRIEEWQGKAGRGGSEAHRRTSGSMGNAAGKDATGEGVGEARGRSGVARTRGGVGREVGQDGPERFALRATFSSDWPGSRLGGITQGAEQISRDNSAPDEQQVKEQRYAIGEERRALARERDAWENSEEVQALLQQRDVIRQQNGIFNGVLKQWQEQTPEWQNYLAQRRAFNERAAQLREQENALGELEKQYEEKRGRLRQEAEQRAQDEYDSQMRSSGMGAEEYHRKLAVQQFGTTDRYESAGYILPDGSMLDFSGGKDKGRRTQDHREIRSVFGPVEAGNNTEITKGMNHFIQEGNIRVMAESPGIDVSAAMMPSQEQFNRIRQMADTLGNARHGFNLDISGENGEAVATKWYEGHVRGERVVNDLKAFYNTGALPEDSGLSQFHSLNIPYSLPDGRSLREYLNEQYRGEPITWTDETTGKRLQMEQAENGAGLPPTNAEKPAAVSGMVTEEAVQSKVPDRMQSTEQEDAAWEQYMPNGWQNLPIEQQIALSERAQKRAEQAAAEQPITQQTVKRNTQGKAQRVQASKTNQFVNTVGEALSVPKGARREFLTPIAQQVAQEMKQTGTVSKESADKLFETAYRQGVVVDEEYYNTYKELKDELRTTAVTLDRESRNSAEYKDIRTRYFGSLKMTNDGGTPVDVKYAELAQRYPELFDEELSSPLDQLERLGEVAKSIQKVGYELDAYYAGDDDFKKYSRLAFDDAIEKMRQDMRLVSRYETDRAAQREKRNQPAQPEPMDEQKAMAIYRQAKQLQKNAEKTVSRELLTEEDQHTVERLLKGDMDIRDLKGENSAGIRRVYEAKKAVQDTLAPVREYNRQKKEALRATAAKDVEKSDAWKDKRWGLGYSTETMERNVRDIVPDRAEAKSINEKYFAPVHANEAKANRWKNELRQEIRALKLTQAESEYLQIYGEMKGADAAARMGHKRSEAELEYLSKAELAWKEEHGQVDMEKINRALGVFQRTYDRIFNEMNEAYVRNGYAPVEYRTGYFPHFSDNKPDGLVARIAQRLGFNPTNDNLPTDIAGLTYSFRPGRKWFGNIKQRTGFETTYDAVKGFDRYVETAADVIFHTDDIQRLRALEDAVRWRNSAEGVKEQAQAIRDDDRLTEDQKAVLLYDLYSKGKSHLANFVQELNEYTNRLAGKKSIHDRSVEADAGRQIYQTMADLESRVAANMVAVNPGSWLTNFIPITQASAETSTGSLIRAAHDTVKAYLVDDGFADTSTFLTNRRGSDPLSRTTVQKLSSILTKPMTYIDDFTSSVVTRAKYLDNVKAGLDAESAMQDADRFAANIMADRSKGALPTIFERKNPLTRLFTMYQVEVNNQLRYLVKDLPDSAKEKGLGMLIAGLLKYTIGAYLFNDLYELLVGRRPALDFLGIANEAIGDATGYQLPNTVEAAEAVLSGEKVDFTTETKGVSDAAAGVAENVAESLPFIGGLLGGGRVPISSALPDIATVSSNALGMMSGEKDSESAWQAIGKELAKPAYYLLPPMGGGQIKKAIEGITTVAQGGQYGTDSSGRRRLKFAVDDPTLGTYAQAAIFGPYSLPSAQEYVNSGFKQKSADYTQAREAAKERNISGEQFDEWWNRMDLNADGKVTEKEALTSLPHLNGVADSTKAFLWSQTAGDTSLEGYRAAQDNGVGNEYFQMRMEADQDKPGESGYGSISSTEMKDWLRRQELGLDKQAALWKTMATYDQQYDYATAQRQGVGDLYVDLLLNADQLYGDGNGYLNKAEIMAYLDAAQLELDVKRLLFGMVSSAKNPY